MNLASKWGELEVIITRKLRGTQKNKHLGLSLTDDF